VVGVVLKSKAKGEQQSKEIEVRERVPMIAESIIIFDKGLR